ncbi:protein FAM124A-like, partial [Colossoma macropomum]|uniref:protein FAM124A-like n=1 Tax=Colossoma macropomum TaxID=42526 RepID=UPI001863E095
VQGSWKQHRHTIAHFSRVPADSSPIPSPPTSEPPHCPPSYGRGPASYRNRRHRTSSRSRTQNAVSPCAPRASLTSLPLLCEQEDLEGVQDSPEDVTPGWMGFRSRSTFSLPTEGFGSGCVSPSAPRPRSLSSLAAPVFRINVDALVGAEETDVDTGQAVSSSSVDLSVVSAYSRPQMRIHSKAHVPRPVSAPPQDGGPDFTALSNDKTYSSLKRHPIPPRTSSISSRSMTSSVHEPLTKNAGASQGQGHVASDTEQHQSNGTGTTEVCRDGTEEDEQEFYI